MSNNPDTDGLDSLQQFMESLGFEYLTQEGQWYKMLSHKWKDGTQAKGRGQYVWPELAEFLCESYKAHQPKQTPPNRYTTKCINCKQPNGEPVSHFEPDHVRLKDGGWACCGCNCTEFAPAAVDEMDELDVALSDLVHEVEWSVQVPGALRIDRPREEAAKLQAKQAIQSHQQHQTAKAVIDARIIQARHLYGHLVLEESDTSCGKRIMKILNQQITDLKNQRNALDKETV